MTALIELNYLRCKRFSNAPHISEPVFSDELSNVVRQRLNSTGSGVICLCLERILPFQLKQRADFSQGAGNFKLIQHHCTRQ